MLIKKYNVVIYLLAQAEDLLALNSPPTWEALGAHTLPTSYVDLQAVQTAALVAVVALGHLFASPAAAAVVWPTADTAMEMPLGSLHNIIYTSLHIEYLVIKPYCTIVQ